MPAGEHVRVTALGGSATAGGQGPVAQEQTYLARVHRWLLSLGGEDTPVDLTVSSARGCVGSAALQAPHTMLSHACMPVHGAA